MTELVDVSDLGSEFWQFESASGYKNTIRYLAQFLPAWWNGRHGGLKSHFRKKCQFESGSGYKKQGGYSLMVKYWIVDSRLWVRFPVAARIQHNNCAEGWWSSG